MITAILALIFYVISPELGIVIAVVTPNVLTLDVNGDYAEVVIEVMFALAVYFVRKSYEDI